MGAHPPPRIDNFLRVSVLRSGKLLAGGAEIRLDELEARLSTLDREKCGLWLYEEPGGESRPPPLADEVKSLIGKLVFEDIPPLYVRVSKKADFSDAIAE